jgi:predicted transcriptional regulator of viral defense system
MIESIRKEIPYEEFDYQTLLQCLKEYAHPRDKITDLLRKKDIVRIKKGLYIFGDKYSRKPYSREILSNLIYGPSYISLEYALQYHGLIPERVEAITAVTTGRARRFSTPVGLFIYNMIPLNAFSAGMDTVLLSDGRSFLIATPEKALADKVYKDRGARIKTKKDMRSYLEENLRIESASLKKLRPGNLLQISQRYRSRRVKLLSDLIDRMNGGME